MMIRVENLRKSFGALVAVDGLSFDLRENEILGLLGPNGAGKTTTINMICGLLPPDEGSITFGFENGRDRKSSIGYCSQENIYYPRLTCLEQMVFIGRMYNISAREARQKALKLLTLLGLQDKFHVRAANLSGGMKRRLNICLALVHDPELLILDEPEAGLDPQSRILVRDFIKSLGKRKSVILTTHNMDEADRLADRVAIIDNGKLLMLDAPRNLKSRVGEGDILEIVLENIPEERITSFSEKLSQLSLKVRTSDQVLFIRHTNIIEYLPAIKNLARCEGITISEIKLRENTLEDVFIHLTGRTLRQ